RGKFSHVDPHDKCPHCQMKNPPSFHIFDCKQISGSANIRSHNELASLICSFVKESAGESAKLEDTACATSDTDKIPDITFRFHGQNTQQTFDVLDVVITNANKTIRDLHPIPVSPSPQNENNHETQPPDPGELPTPGEERGSPETPAETHDSGDSAGTNQTRPSTNRTQRSQSRRDNMTMKDVIKEVESPVKAAEQSKRQVYQNLAAVRTRERLRRGTPVSSLGEMVQIANSSITFIPFAVRNCQQYPRILRWHLPFYLTCALLCGLLVTAACSPI
ncbi:hypothetical protein ADUPG1_013857, partial [Aduncisulcus paluster]